MNGPFHQEVIWIVGASSGIGRALAVHLAAQGARLVLSARSREALEALKAELGEGHLIYPLDIADIQQTQLTAQAIRAAVSRIDRVIFLAAVYTPMPLASLDLAATRHMIDVNLFGAFNLIHAVLPLLKAQNKGQIALCASVAGYVGLPDGQPYSATKAGLINLAESLRAECGPGLDIKLINPGFVQTPMTDKNDFSMPMMVRPEAAAKAIADGLIARPFEIHFPKLFTWGMKLLRALPYIFSLPLTRTFTRKH